MAKTFTKLIPTFLIILFTIFFFSTIATAQEQDNFSTTLSPEKHGLKQENLTQFHFYLHDVVVGSNLTAVTVAEAPTTSNSSTTFGLVVVMDDPLTVLPESSSKLVGRAQGIYASVAQTEVEVLFVFNIAFTEGKYNGSNLSVLGRETLAAAVSEFPIVGGTGLFRFARGYALVKIYSLDNATGNGVLEFNVYVLHY